MREFRIGFEIAVVESGGVCKGGGLGTRAVSMPKHYITCAHGQN